MKQITNTIKSNIFNLKMLSLVALAGFMFSCEDNVLPEANSIEDLTPPSAMFSATESNGDWQTYDFSNQSVSSTTHGLLEMEIHLLQKSLPTPMQRKEFIQ